MKNDTVDPYNYDYLERLACHKAGQGRLFLGQAAKARLDQPALLFVHGGFMGAWAFSGYLAYFDNLDIPSAAVDCRGHGGLVQGQDFLQSGIADYAQDVVAAAQVFECPPILVGHSLGALTASVAMGQCAVSGLGLLAPSPPGQMPGAHPTSLVDEEHLVRPGLKAAGHLAQGIPKDAIARFQARLCPESPTALNDRYGLRVASAAPRDVPSICIAAQYDDPLRHPPGQDFAVGDFFGAENHMLPEAPHCFMSTLHWRTSAVIIETWYRRNFGHAE